MYVLISIPCTHDPEFGRKVVFWRDRSEGVTSSIGKAGTYDEEEAREMVAWGIAERQPSDGGRVDAD